MNESILHKEIVMKTIRLAALATPFLLFGAIAGPVAAADTVQLGPRPFYLVEEMEPSPLKTELQQCSKGPFVPSDFSIGHRGACMQFPEHTRESYVAAARMGAGIVECDVTFTKDRILVCRHSQCDLHATTNILAVPELAAKCSEPFTPAQIDPQSGMILKEASAKCCTSDITLAEFKKLKGKMDGSNPKARTVGEFMKGTPPWRTDLYTSQGTLMTHAESIQLFKSLGVKMTPELKQPSVNMPFEGNYSQEQYAQQMIDEYKAAGIAPSHVFAQSFHLPDVLHWLKHDPQFGNQAVFLDDRDQVKTFDHNKPETWIPGMKELADKGVKIIAPPMWMLLTLDEGGRIVPSPYAKEAKAAGLEIITWTLERSGLLTDGGGWYYKSISKVTNNPGDMLEVLDILARDVGIRGIFSDWPATVTYYANCKKLK